MKGQEVEADSGLTGQDKGVLRQMGLLAAQVKYVLGWRVAHGQTGKLAAKIYGLDAWQQVEASFVCTSCCVQMSLKQHWSDADKAALVND